MANPHLFKKGQSGNPKGRPKGSTGRMAALMILDHLLLQAPNQRLLKIKMQSEFSKNPVKFFKEIVMPLTPKEQLLRMETIEKSPVRIILTNPENDDASTQEAA